MIIVQEEKGLLTASVYGELTLADYRELEQAVINKLKAQRKLNLLLDLRNMASFTLDVVWEDIKFTRSHPHDFARIAVIADEPWTPWLSWLGTAFTDADTQTFSDPALATAWARGR